MEDEIEPKCAKFFTIPHRYILTTMTSLAIVNCYTLRVSLSTAITEMIRVKDNDTQVNSHCVTDLKLNTSESFLTSVDPETMFDWTASERGLIMSSFYIGYILSHLPGGVLADKYGAKHILGVGILITAVLTLITPAILKATNGNTAVFIALRVLEGLGEGQSYPAANVILGQWIPLSERGLCGSIVWAGSQFGTIFSNLISGHLIAATNSWASVFYFFGALACLWWLIWLVLCYSTPEVHPCLSNKEKRFLRAELASEHVSYGKKIVPWMPILKSLPVWSLILVQIGHDWGWYTMVTDLPKYMKHVIGFSVSQNGTMSAIPYFVMWIVSLGSGFLCDYLINHNIMKLTAARKMFNSIGAIGPAAFLIGAGYTGCSKIAAVFMFTMALGTMGTYYCGLKVNALDLSPNYAGTLMALSNGAGSLTGFVTGSLTSILTPHNSIAEWRIVLILSCLILFTTNFAFIFFGSGDEQWWNDTTKVIEYYENKKAARAARREARRNERAAAAAVT